jgi:hypothetical protein
MTTDLLKERRGRNYEFVTCILHHQPSLELFGHFSQARSSVGERFLDTEEVGSSILPVPTIFF